MRQNGSNAIRSPDVSRISSKNLFVHSQSSVLVSLLLILILDILIQSLQPNVSQGYERISVGICRRVLDDTLELFLPRTILHLGQMKISQKRPGVRMLVVDSQCILEPIGGLVDLTFVPGHATQTKITVHVVRVFF